MAGYSFRRKEDIAKTLELIGMPRPRQLQPQLGTVQPEVQTHGFIFQTPGGGISALSGSTAGSAECTPYYINPETGVLTELTDDSGASQTKTVYHIGPDAVAGSIYIQAKRIYGVLVADVEYCT